MPATGACPDEAFGGSSNHSQLISASRSDGITTLLLRRPLDAMDNVDSPILPSTPSNFIWAQGALRAPLAAENACQPPQGPAYRLAQHATNDNSYGTLQDLVLNGCPSECTPLTAVPAAAAAPPAPPGMKGPVVLQGGGVSLYWQLDGGGDDAAVSFTVRALLPATWLSLAVGRGMIGAHAYVAWVAPDGLRVEAYAMDSLDAAGVRRRAAPVNATDASYAGGVLSFTFRRPLRGGPAAAAGEPPIDPEALPLVWAVGNGWAEPLANRAQHFAQGTLPTLVNLRTGAVSGAAVPAPAALVAHGVLMTAAYAALLPAAACAARYLRAGAGPPGAWFAWHTRLAAAALAAAAAGAAAAMALQYEQRRSFGLYTRHAQLGVAALALLLAQPLLALRRPPPLPPPPAGDAAGAGAGAGAACGGGAAAWPRRRVWALMHRLGAAAAAAVGAAALFTGIDAACARGLDGCAGLTAGLAVWVGFVAAYVAAREAAGRMWAAARRRREEAAGAAAAAAGPARRGKAGDEMVFPAAAKAAAADGYAVVPADDAAAAAEAAVVSVRPDSDGEAGSGDGDGADADVAAPGRQPGRGWGLRPPPTAEEWERWWALPTAAWTLLGLLLSLLAAAGVLGRGGGPGACPLVAAGGAVAAGSAAAHDGRPAATPLPAYAVALRQRGCALTQPFEYARLGDGWCDAGAPYNTAACGYDGGDCCPHPNGTRRAAITECLDPASPRRGDASPAGAAFPAPRNPRYSDPGPGRQLSTPGLVAGFTNFYEFTTAKEVLASGLVTPAAAAALGLAAAANWTVVVDGAVARPLRTDLLTLLGMFQLEERVYRHRCVETWSIVVPWTGFPLRKLLAAVGPLPAATFVRFETLVDRGVFPQQARSPKGLYPGAPWPYVEGLSIEEAWNDLPFLSVGSFGGPLPAQNGAPLRLNVPHKYGFKSVKSVVRISFETAQPLNWWQAIAPSEYGFWANVNPAFPHPRWSQATEGPLVDRPSPAARVPTTIFNGYGAEVAHLYGTTRDYFY